MELINISPIPAVLCPPRRAAGFSPSQARGCAASTSRPSPAARLQGQRPGARQTSDSGGQRPGAQPSLSKLDTSPGRLLRPRTSGDGEMLEANKLFSLPTEQGVFPGQGTTFQVPLKPHERIRRREGVGVNTNSSSSPGT